MALNTYDGGQELNDLYDLNNIQLMPAESSEKRTIATQVDYISLIMDRNYEEMRTTNGEQQQQQINRTFDSIEESMLLMRAKPAVDSASSSHTAYSDVNVKRHRKRLTSAPTNMKDACDVGDVNLVREPLCFHSLRES